MMRHLKNKLALISLLIFILSLFFNAFKVKDMGQIKDYSSLEVFLIGPISFLGGAGKEFFTWTANIWFLISLFCVFRRYYFISIISGLIAFLISGTFIFYKEILVSESGRMADIYSLEIGYYLWLTSIVFIIFSSIYLKIIDRISNAKT
ncbi:hypothetical protein A0O34_14585 [Chryseobacterium glaciei]|uniref:Uncharacterized protein n=1 Tax=Chryseobacterium glaciei TaxID=1685010 RepID=A0A172XXH4_9FLAO|nr:hypothetical protein [Chryseobacterium glaciei]ANF51654.1 hypothetical protein A0O34_14585 [Chryseobacterium glaciei]